MTTLQGLRVMKVVNVVLISNAITPTALRTAPHIEKKTMITS